MINIAYDIYYPYKTSFVTFLGTTAPISMTYVSNQIY